jgi:hypothetical protein
MLTRNQKAWADSAVKLLEWSSVGSHNVINQCAMPALIVVLNGPSVENEAWISDDYDAATDDFFQAVEQEIHENAVLRQMAQKVNRSQVYYRIIADTFDSMATSR